MSKKNKKSGTAGKVLRTLTTVLFIACTILCFVVTIRSVTKKDVSIFGYRLFYVVSGSMEPTLPVGSLLVVKEQDSYEVNDIITFYSKDESIKGYPNTHRIVGISEKNGEKLYITKGDANSQSDDPIGYDDIIGKVRFSLETGFVSGIIELLSSPSGFFVIILIPILIVTLICMKDLKKSIQEVMRNSAIEAIKAEQKSADAESDIKKECPENETERKDTTE